jgi:hypothetical protein
MNMFERLSAGCHALVRVGMLTLRETWPRRQTAETMPPVDRPRPSFHRNVKLGEYGPDEEAPTPGTATSRNTSRRVGSPSAADLPCVNLGAPHMIGRRMSADPSDKLRTTIYKRTTARTSHPNPRAIHPQNSAGRADSRAAWPNLLVVRIGRRQTGRMTKRQRDLLALRCTPRRRRRLR